MEVCGITTFEAVRKAAEKGKVWYFTGDVVDLVKFELKMEVYKLYIDAWHVWTDKYGLMYHEVTDEVGLIDARNILPKEPSVPWLCITANL